MSNSAATGTAHGLGGQMYQVGMSMLLIVRAKARSYANFCIQSEVQNVGAFDDIEFKNNESVQFIQLKLKSRGSQQIRAAELFQQNQNKMGGDYNLLKYIVSCMLIKEQDRFKTGIATFDRAIIFTNIPLKVDPIDMTIEVRQLQGYASQVFKEITQIKLEKIILREDDILNFNNSDYTFYKFSDNRLPQLFKTLADQFTSELLKQSNPGKNEYDKWLLQNSKTLTIEDIKSCLDKIVFACNQPNDSEVFEIVKEDIQKYCKVQTDLIYNKLKDEILEWMKTKTGFFCSEIGERAVQTFFDMNAKVIAFNITEPVSTFVGREDELRRLHELLHGNSNIVITQANQSSTGISGLGGVGKTQLAKMFVKKYKDDYYGRVIWISAETRDSIEDSFKRLERHIWNKAISSNVRMILEKIIEYFKDYKTLFVFDNVEIHPETEQEDYIFQFRSLAAPLSTFHILITSRDKKYIGNATSIDLDVLNIKDAGTLIMNQLPDTNLKDADQLVELLQNFPLALQQAIAYIKQERDTQSLHGLQFGVTDYMKRFLETSQNLLSYQFTNEFGRLHSETTLITWLTTVKTLQETHLYGQEAIHLLNIFAYMNPDNIFSEFIFDTFYDEYEIEERKPDVALLLLERYSMISRYGEQSARFYIHRLVQFVVRNNLESTKVREDTEKGSMLACITRTIIQHQFDTKEEVLLDFLLRKCFYAKNLHLDWISNQILKEVIWDQTLKYKKLLKKYSKARIGLSLPLEYACKLDKLDAIKFLLEKLKVDPNARDLTNRTPLINAICDTKVKVVKILLENGVEINYNESKMLEAIKKVVVEENKDLIKILVEAGMQLNVIYNEDTSILHYAVQVASVEFMEFLLSDETYCIIKNCAERKISYRIRHKATQIKRCMKRNQVKSVKDLLLSNHQYVLKDLSKQDIETLQLLVEDRLNIDFVDKERDTPLHFAAYKELVPFIDLLCKKGANISMENIEGDTAFKIALKSRNIDSIIFYLLNKNDDASIIDQCGHTAIQMATMLNQLHIIHKISSNTNKCFDINIQDKYQNTLLHLCFWKCNALKHFKLKKDYHTQCNIVSFLVSNGIEIDKSNSAGDTVLHVALKQNDLTSNDPINDILNERYQLTKMHEGIKVTLEMYQMLMKNIVNLNMQNNLGQTLLHIAAEANNFQIIKVLLEKGCKSEVKNINGHTAFHIACIRNHKETIECLLQSNDDNQKLLSEVDNKSRTPLHLLTLSGLYTLLRFLFRNTSIETPDIAKISDVLMTSHQIPNNSPQVAIRNRFLKPNEILYYSVDELKLNVLKSALDDNTFSLETLLRVIDLEILNDYEYFKLVETMSNQLLMKSMAVLIDIPLDINTADDEGNTALHYAIIYCQMEIITVFLKSGANPNLTNNLGDAPLHLAVKLCLFDKVNYLLQMFPNIDLHVVDMDGNTFLHLLASIVFINQDICDNREFLSIIESLVDKNLPYNTNNKLGYTPLDYAIINGHPTLIELLLHKPIVNLNLQDQQGRSILHLATLSGNIKALEIVVEQTKDVLNINQLDVDSHTALDLAVQSKYFVKEIGQLLLKNGATLKSHSIDSLLHLAVIRGQFQVVQFLCELNSSNNVNTNVDDQGNTTLHHASMEGHIEIIQYLISINPVLINIQNNFGETPLYKAIFSGQIDSVLTFFKYEQNLQIRNNEGDTLLHAAVKYADKFRYPDTIVMEFLLNAGLNVNATNNFHETPLHIAVSLPCYFIIEFLLDNAADPMICDQNGKTPYDVVCQNKITEFVQLFEMFLK